MEAVADQTEDDAPQPMSNAEIADRLAGLAQLLSTQKENPYKVRAYRRAAAKIRSLSESLDEMVRTEADLTRFAGVGEGIAGAIREIVRTGTLHRLERLRAEAPPALAGLNAHPRLDPKRVMRVYKKLSIASIGELRLNLENGEIQKRFGARMAQHIEQGLTEAQAMLLYRADDLAVAVEAFLVDVCRVHRAQVAGDYRRRVETIEELVFVVESADFASVVARMKRYGGRTPLVSSGDGHAVFALSAGVLLRLQLAAGDWGFRMVTCTGSRAHLEKLKAVAGPLQGFRPRAFATEAEVYGEFGLAYIEPELREGNDEIERAAKGRLPVLVTVRDVRGELHAHSTSSDGSNSIEDMAAAALERGYEYLGITDHSQSLKIARGVPVEALLLQIRYIEELNGRLRGIQVLKSAEVDILEDGSLDYPDEVLRELDYTVCSIHSRFNRDRETQTDRILRAMDNRYFHILGHATGRLLLTRPGYEIDLERVIEHARQRGCFFEINSSPNRLDLSAENARLAASAGVRIAVNTDAHSTGEYRLIRCGIDQARRAGLESSSILNCQPLPQLLRLFRR